jgi:hypothetical protein
MKLIAASARGLPLKKIVPETGAKPRSSPEHPK